MKQKRKQSNQSHEYSWHRETRVLHDGWHPETPGEPVVPSWEPSTIFRHPSDGLSADSWSYTRLDNPNRAQLEKTLAGIEGGADALTFASGMAAVQAVFHILSPGDHVLLPDDLYHGVRNLIRDQYTRWGLSFDFVDMTSDKQVREAARENTRLLWLESPSNPMLKISNIAGLTTLAREKNWITVLDNTWSTPVIQRPLDLGVDIVLYSTTKFIGGHSDALGGALIVGHPEDHNDSQTGLQAGSQPASRSSVQQPASGRNAKDGSRPDVDRTEISAGLRKLQAQAGSVPSPFDCWLMLRSLKTLYARIKTQCANAQLIAGRLRGHHAVEKVYYPGLQDHEGQEIASRQMDMPGSMISFQVRGDMAAALRVVNAARLIIPATSLGGVESTWEHRKTSEYAESPTPENLIRLSIGIEHPEDIWQDIVQSLESLFHASE